MGKSLDCSTLPRPLVSPPPTIVCCCERGYTDGRHRTTSLFYFFKYSLLSRLRFFSSLNLAFHMTFNALDYITDELNQLSGLVSL